MNILTNTAPKDLRGSSPTQAGGGKLHKPDPEAVRKLQARSAAARQEKEAGDATAAAAAEQQPSTATEETPQRRSLERPIDPSVYPTAVREAAAKQLAKDPAKRRYAKVFTPEVVAIWQQFVNEGKSTEWLAAYNGLVPVANETVRSYLGRYKGTIKKATAAPPPVVAQKAAQPRPALRAETVAAASPALAPETAAVTPAPNPQPPAPTQLATLAALLETFAREPISLHGRININLEIEIGSPARQERAS